MSSDSRARSPLPPDLLLGVGTADHQCEAYDARWEDVHDVWERSHGRTQRGRATEFWTRYPEDVELARSLGCTAFRFSIAWARVEPQPGKFNRAALRHYREMAQAIRAAGMEPVVTLHHFTWPVHVEQRGGMVADGFPQIFGGYVTEVVKALGDLVGYWITCNEPTVLVYGYLKPWWQRDYVFPPGMPSEATHEDQMAAVARLIRNMFRANRIARTIIKAGRPDAMVSANAYVLGLPAWLQRYLDRSAQRLRDHDHLAGHGSRLSKHLWPGTGTTDVVMASLPINSRHVDEVDFSEPYYTVRRALLVRASEPFDGVEQLAGEPVGVVTGVTLLPAVELPVPGMTAVPYKDGGQALEALEGGEVAAVFGHQEMLDAAAAEHPGRYRLVSVPGLKPESYGAAAAKGNPDLLHLIEKAVRGFKHSGDWQRSHRRHFSEHPPAEPPAHAIRSLAHLRPKAAAQGRDHPHGRALRRILSRGHLVVGVTEDEPGLGYRDPQTGRLSGLEIDLAHRLAEVIFGDPSRVRFRALNAPHERIGLVRSVSRAVDRLLRNFSILTTALNSNWWHLGMAGKLPEFLCPPECVGEQDFVGLDYYWGMRSLALNHAHKLADAMAGGYEGAPVWPGALYKTLRYIARMFPGQPVIVVENGCVDHADGVDRATYIDSHIREIERAAREGVNLTGYICWAITSNREWGLHFDRASDFGLFHIDLDEDAELKRISTPAAEAYRRNIARIRGVEPAPS